MVHSQMVKMARETPRPEVSSGFPTWETEPKHSSHLPLIIPGVRTGTRLEQLGLKSLPIWDVLTTIPHMGSCIPLLKLNYSHAWCVRIHWAAYSEYFPECERASEMWKNKIEMYALVQSFLKSMHNFSEKVHSLTFWMLPIFYTT